LDALTVTDDDGASNTVYQSITVSSSGTPIGALGGTVTSADNTISLTIPAGALNNTVAISITKRTNYPSGKLVDTVYELQPEGLVFDTSVQLTTFYNPANLPAGFDESTLRAGKISGDSIHAWQQVLEYTVDPSSKSVTSTLDSFSSYGILSGDAFSDISATVYKVDSVPDGSNVHFTDLNSAMSYLASNLNAWESGKVLIQTNNTLNVSSLNFTHNIVLEIDDGFTPTIAGPGMNPLPVTASGSLGLSGLTILNAGGMVINAQSDVIMSNFNFPTTTVNVGAAGGGPLKTPLNSRLMLRNGAGVSGSAWKISNGFLDGPLMMGFSSQIAGIIDMRNIAAPEIQLSSTSYASARIAVAHNIVDNIGISMELGFGAGLRVENHANLNDLNIDTQTDVSLDLNMLGTINLEGEIIIENVTMTGNGGIGLNGNSCADYPSDHNMKDAEGNCNVDGISPASG